MAWFILRRGADDEANERCVLVRLGIRGSVGLLFRWEYTPSLFIYPNKNLIILSDLLLHQYKRGVAGQKQVDLASVLFCQTDCLVRRVSI